MSTIYAAAIFGAESLFLQKIVHVNTLSVLTHKSIANIDVILQHFFNIGITDAHKDCSVVTKEGRLAFDYDKFKL